MQCGRAVIIVSPWLVHIVQHIHCQPSQPVSQPCPAHTTKRASNTRKCRILFVFMEQYSMWASCATILYIIHWMTGGVAGAGAGAVCWFATVGPRVPKRSDFKSHICYTSLCMALKILSAICDRHYFVEIQLWELVIIIQMLSAGQLYWFFVFLLYFCIWFRYEETLHIKWFLVSDDGILCGVLDIFFILNLLRSNA